jgi:hypothetical protein
MQTPSYFYKFLLLRRDIIQFFKISNRKDVFYRINISKNLNIRLTLDFITLMST